MTRSTLLILMAAACASTGEVPLDTAFSLRLGETATVGSTGVNVTFADVADSRCPRNAVCVWEGEATAHLRVNDETLSVKVPGTVTFGSYEIEVREVNPYPEDPPPAKSRYTATIVVRASGLGLSLLGLRP